MTDYITSANFKTRNGITITTNDARIAAHITAASLEIDAWCGRQFGPGDDEPSARYFHPTTWDTVRIDDAYGITEVAVDLDETGTYTTVVADYVTLPLNGIGPNSQPGWPVTEIDLINPTYALPRCRRPSVKVTAQWGWEAIPTDVAEACYLMANRLFYEVSVPGGITAPNVEFGIPGAPLQRQYTAERLLKDYRRAEKVFGIAG